MRWIESEGGKEWREAQYRAGRVPTLTGELHAELDRLTALADGYTDAANQVQKDQIEVLTKERDAALLQLTASSTVLPTPKQHWLDEYQEARDEANRLRAELAPLKPIESLESYLARNPDEEWMVAHCRALARQNQMWKAACWWALGSVAVGHILHLVASVL